MRYIDRTNCRTAFERGETREVISLGPLSAVAAGIAKADGLGVMKTRQGAYRIVTESGLGAYSDFFSSLAEVDAFLRDLDAHKSTKY